VLRQIPIWNGELNRRLRDLALERALSSRAKASEVIALEGGNLDREKEAAVLDAGEARRSRRRLEWSNCSRTSPARATRVFDDLARELRAGLICPVLLGSALRENGVLRLMKALLHESPDVTETAARLGVTANKDGWPM